MPLPELVPIALIALSGNVVGAWEHVVVASIQYGWVLLQIVPSLFKLAAVNVQLNVDPQEQAPQPRVSSYVGATSVRFGYSAGHVFVPVLATHRLAPCAVVRHAPPGHAPFAEQTVTELVVTSGSLGTAVGVALQAGVGPYATSEIV